MNMANKTRRLTERKRLFAEYGECNIVESSLTLQICLTSELHGRVAGIGFFFLTIFESVYGGLHNYGRSTLTFKMDDRFIDPGKKGLAFANRT